MKKKLQKKLDKLGDRLKNSPLYNSTCKDCGKNYNDFEVARIYGIESMPYILGYCSARCYTKFKNLYDIQQKGLKFDALKKDHEALKKRNGELVEALEGITDKSNKPQFHNFLIHANQALDNINDIAIKALKNNDND